MRAGALLRSTPRVPVRAQHLPILGTGHFRLQQEMAMQMLKQTVWTSLNNADAWVVCIGVMSCLGLATGLLG